MPLIGVALVLSLSEGLDRSDGTLGSDKGLIPPLNNQNTRHRVAVQILVFIADTFTLRSDVIRMGFQHLSLIAFNSKLMLSSATDRLSTYLIR